MALAQLVNAETETLHGAGPKILHQDIRLRDQLGEHLAPGRAFDVDRPASRFRPRKSILTLALVREARRQQRRQRSLKQSRAAKSLKVAAHPDVASKVSLGRSHRERNVRRRHLADTRCPATIAAG